MPTFALLILPAALALEALYFMAKWLYLGTAGIKGHQSTRSDDPFGYYLILASCFLVFLFAMGCSVFIYHLAHSPFGITASLNILILLFNLGLLFIPPKNRDTGM